MDEAWFKDNFFDIRQNKPKKGQCLATFRANADFVDDWVKRNVIALLRDNPVGAESAQKVLFNMCGAVESDSIRIPLEMARDLQTMTVDEVAKKDYKMTIEYHYWVAKENVPANNPHWTIIDILNIEDIDDRIKFAYPSLS